MIWRAIKFITLSEVIAWVAFFFITLALWAFGVRAEGGKPAVMLFCWIVLFVTTYQVLKRRRAR